MTPDHGLDRLLDRAVLPGYSSIGHRIRRRAWREDDPGPGALIGRRALVTGAGSGVGEAAALGLARLGAHVHLLARSRSRAQPARDRIAATLAREGHSASLEIETCDVSDLTAVRAFADGLAERLGAHDRSLDVIVHNAGVLPPERTLSADGHELSVATHVLGPVLMTETLLPALERSPKGARVVLVSSGGMYGRRLPARDPDYREGRYRGVVAYARSKRMQVELAPVLSDRWSVQRVGVYAMHPGWVDTPGVAAALPLFRALTRPLLRADSAGADTIVWLAGTSPAPETRGFWHDRARRPIDYRRATRSTPAEVERFMTWVRQATALG